MTRSEAVSGARQVVGCLVCLTAFSRLVAAADLPVTERLVQQVGVPLEATIGDPVMRIERSAPLPNIFGAADIFGRTVDKGFKELRFQGLRDGKLVFRLVDIDTRSNETTMSRSKVSISSGNATSRTSSTATVNPLGYGATVSGNATTKTVGNALTVSSPDGRTDVLPPNTTEFLVDPEKRREIRIGTVKVKVLEVDDLALKYELEQSAPAKPQ